MAATTSRWNGSANAWTLLRRSSPSRSAHTAQLPYEGGVTPMNRLRAAALAASCAMAVGAGDALAQAPDQVPPRWVLENHGYYDPVLAEPRAAQTTVLFPTIADSFPFAVEDRRGMIWDISVGNEFPIVGFSRQRGSETAAGVPAGGFGIGVWFPLSFHVVEDL